MPEKSILIGHSLGATFALRVLEKLKHPITGAFLAAPVSGLMENEFDPLVKNFLENGFDWEKIIANCPHITVLYGERDPYVSLQQSQTLAKNLECRMITVPDGRHLNDSAGFSELPGLIDLILTNTSLLGGNSSLL